MTGWYRKGSSPRREEGREQRKERREKREARRETITINMRGAKDEF